MVPRSCGLFCLIFSLTVLSVVVVVVVGGGGGGGVGVLLLVGSLVCRQGRLVILRSLVLLIDSW